jgi:hypothetical protein
MYKIGTKSVPKAQFTEPQNIIIPNINPDMCVYAHKVCDIAHTHCRGAIKRVNSPIETVQTS